MDRFFNPDNAFFSAVNKIIDLFVLSVLWMLLCIPVITAGAASTGMYYAVVKSVRRGRSYPVREFFRAFRENFVKATIIWILLLVVGGMLCISDFPVILSFLSSEKTVDFLFLGLFGIKGFFFFGIGALIFPLLSRFQGSVLIIFENTFVLCVKKFLRTLGTIFILGTGAVLVMADALFLALVPGACVWLLSFLWEPVFSTLAGKLEKDGAVQERDRWYMEMEERYGTN